MKAWLTGHVWLAMSITFVLGAAVGASGSRAADEKDVAPASVSEDASTPGNTYTPQSEQVEPEDIEEFISAEPDARFSETCDYLLGDGLDDNELIGQSRIKNTGNVGVNVKVTFLWGQAGAAPVKIIKEVDIPYNDTRVVKASAPADYDTISRLQALPYDQQCKVKVALVDTFGEAQ